MLSHPKDHAYRDLFERLVVEAAFAWQRRTMALDAPHYTSVDLGLAKDYGVAFIRNHDRFHEQVDLAHPAEFFGDVGAATAPILIALAVTHLLDDAKPALDLVYASADGPKRGAIVVEKVPV